MAYGAIAPILLALSTWLLYNAYTIDHAQGGSWGCEMSWMTPSYELVQTLNSPVPRYKLYLYREQGWDLEPEPDAVPVIFIPGNAGSFQQVRSIASSVSRQYHGNPGGTASGMHNVKKPDLFTLDLNEDFGALHGNILRDQAKFLAHAIAHVLSRYRTERVILIGHSMGGIVAKMGSTLIENPAQIDLIITLSTPHALPPITLDWAMETAFRTTSPAILPSVISICGGSADTQIASDACVVDQDSDRSFTVFTTGIAGVWTGVDHQAIVWCHQLRFLIARVLLDLNTRDASRLSPFDRATRRLHPQTSFSEIISANPVGTSSLSLPIDGPTTLLFLARPQGVSLCQDGSCGVSGILSEAVPLLTAGAPFPFPGEGVKDHEIGHMITTNATGVLTASLQSQADIATGRHVTQTVKGTVWRRTLNGTRFTLEFPSLRTSSLKAYRLETVLGDCSGPEPVIRQSVLGRPNAIEHRFFAANASPIILHSHIGPAPFIRTSPNGLTLDILQWPGCTIEQITIVSDSWRTFAKALPRLRMGFIAWTVAWAAIMASNCIDDESSDDAPRARPLIVALCSLFGTSILQPWLPYGHHLLLGSPGAERFYLHTAFAGITLTAAFTLHAFLKGCHALWTTFTRASQFGPTSDPHTGQSKRVLMALAIFLGVFTPVELERLILIGCLLARCIVMDLHPTITWMIAGCLAVSPADIAPVVAWSRAALADIRHAPRMSHNVATIVPILLLISSAGRNLASHKKRRLTLCKISLHVLATVSFLLGPRHTYLVPWCFHLALMCLCLLV